MLNKVGFRLPGSFHNTVAYPQPALVVAEVCPDYPRNFADLLGG